MAKDERFLKKENHITDGICFHCQQAVEKYLKAFLTLNDIDIGKTHNLEILARHCSKVDADFNGLNFGNLSQYGVAVTVS
jgi:HEPN domain-containing protein